MAADPEELTRAAAQGAYTGGSIDPAVSEDAKTISAAIVFAGLTIARAIRDSNADRGRLGHLFPS